MVKRKASSAVMTVANALRGEIFKSADGEFLGSETDLVGRLGVSRPTFRQATKLLEHEQLLLIKRGVGGGFFSKLPSAKAVVHMATIYLQARHTTLEHAIRAARPLFIESARLAAKRKDPTVQASFEDFLEKDRQLEPESQDLKSFFRIERQFGGIFSGASGNPVLALFVEVLFSFSARLAEGIYGAHPERLPTYRQHRNAMIKAIIDGDEEVAGIMALRRSDIMLQWLTEDQTRRRGRLANPIFLISEDQSRKQPEFLSD